MTSRADLWIEVFSDIDNLKEIAKERSHIVVLVANFLDKHLGEDWQYNKDLTTAFEDALKELEERINEH